MKYKVGDKVRIKSIEWYNKRKDTYDNVVGIYDSFTINMSKYCGQTATIVEIKNSNANSCPYTLDIDDGIYSWYDFMFEDSMQQLSESPDSLIKTLKITVPEGYEIDEEKSTFKEIVFKKQSAIITWDIIHNGVEIVTDCEHFVIKCDVPALYCNWNDAQRYIQDIENWIMPSVNQLKVVKTHLTEINKVISNHYGYKICDKNYWSNDHDSFTDTAKSVNMNDGVVYWSNKDYWQNVVVLVKII